MAYYYAIVDVNYIVTDVVEEVEPVDESNWLPIDSYNMDLVGLWYNVNDQTFSDVGNKYLISLKNVDGAGCGLDADLLDGKHASEFALANHTHADSGTVGEHDHDDEYAPINHTHTEYAPVNHEHTGYADADHNHDTAYAPLNHTHEGVGEHDHDADYAPINHNHDSAYAGINHDHDDDYAPVSHTHTGFASENHTHSGYATTSHNHDSAYAPKSHTHDYAASGHNHDSAYAAKSHTHDYAASSHNHDSDYADIDHNHDSDYLKLSGGTVEGNVNVTSAFKIDSQFVVTHDGTTISLGSVNKATTINCLSTADMILNGVGCWIPTLKPRGGNGNQNVGTASYRFKYAYLQNTPNVSSDERLKQDIESVKDTDMLDFIEKLDVVNYAFKDEPDIERIGLIAQAVEKAGGQKYIDIDEEGMYGLRTADLVYPLISSIQVLSKRIKELESKLNE